MRWMCATVAPWAMAGGLLVSFTASANNDPQSGMSAVNRSALAPLTDSTGLIPPVAADLGLGLARPVLPASLLFDAPGETASLLQHRSPRPDLKAGLPPHPAVDRTGKGDPLAIMHPTLSRRAGDVRDRLTSPGSRLVFSRDDRLLPPTILMEGRVEGPDME